MKNRNRDSISQNEIVDISPGVFQSGQMGQTVNLLAFAFGGSNPSAPTNMRK